MKFEEQFPSLKGRERKIEEIAELYGVKFINKDTGNFVKIERFFVEINTIQEHCLDKQKRYALTTEQLLFLFIKGETETGYGLKLSALCKPEKYGTVVKKIIDLETYKQKVKEAIDTLLNVYTIPPTENIRFRADLDSLKRELGLE